MATARKPSARYRELIDRFPLRPIRTEAELDRAIEVIDGLLDRSRRSRDEEDYLDVLGTLVERYEDEHHPIAAPTAEEMLAFLIEQRGMPQAGVAAGSGIAESTLSAVLRGKRSLTRKHIEVLARYFGVQPSVFVG